jgi:signal transduction histidine kinase/tetratricopeptide (TPR) repeat protein
MLLLILKVLSHTCLAQEGSKIDSLTNVLRTQKEDSSKVKTLNAFSRQLWQKASYVEAKKYADNALTLAEKIKFNIGKADAYHNIAIIFVYQSKYQEALKNHLAGLKISEGIGYKKGMADSYNGIAGVYFNQGNYPEALKNLSASLKLEEEAGNKKGVANLFNNIGLIYLDQGNYPDALKNFYASLKIKEKIGDKRGMASSLYNLGLVYINQGNYSEALKNHVISLKLREEIGDKKGMAYSYNNIGYIFEKQSNYSDALTNHLISLKIRKEIGDNKGTADSYNNIGEAYLGLKKFLEAKQFFNDGLSLSKKIGAKEILKKSYEGLARLDSATDNWKGAYHNNKLAILYRDSLVNVDNSKKVIQAQMQYEFTKKEDSLKYKQTLTNEKLIQQSLLTQQQQQELLIKENEYSLMMNEKALQHLEIEKNHADYAMQKAKVDKDYALLSNLQKEKSIQNLQLKRQKLIRNYLFLVLALFSILSFFIYKNYSARQKLKLLTLRDKIARDLHDDVGSTLSSISIFSQIVQQQSKEVIPMLETIGDSSRKMLDAMADIVWTINPENDQFEKIILRMRSFAYEVLGAKQIDFEFIADEEVAKLKLLMDVRKNLYLIFKEAINNMVKYSGADKALFSIKGEKNKLHMMIHDNGKGFDTSESTEGNGLKNMKKRASEIGAQIIILSLPGKGTTVQLNVPL